MVHNDWVDNWHIQHVSLIFTRKNLGDKEKKAHYQDQFKASIVALISTSIFLFIYIFH